LLMGYDMELCLPEFDFAVLRYEAGLRWVI